VSSIDVTFTDGPALVRGARVIRDEDGVAHPVERPRVAVCLCGKSAIRPWCDGTHKFVGGQPAAGPGRPES
jgi:CDGSH-type Zn-finger protein